MVTLPLFPDESKTSSSESAPMSVTDVTAHIKRLIEEDYTLQSVWIEGEVSNLSKPSSGHLYFTLKDDEAQMKCVMWRSDVERMGLDIQDHEQILAQGKVSIYDRGGQYQLYVRRIQPVGVGDLNRQLQLLYARLKAEGLFESHLKKPVPSLPLKIGIVTSASTAALQDVLNVLKRRLPLAEVILSPTPVQGVDAPPQIVKAIDLLNEKTNVDVILLVRGGGSLEDLWCFNDEHVVRAVAYSRIPVVSGVGHEIDHMLVDYAAALRAPTPSAAAEVVAPDLRGLQQSITILQDRAYNAMATKIGDMRQHLFSQRRAMRHLSPQNEINNARQRVDEVNARLQRGMHNQLFGKHQTLLRGQSTLRSNDPMGILARGYAVVSRVGDGKRLVSANDAAPGTALEIQLFDGTLQTSVKSRKLEPLTLLPTPKSGKTDTDTSQPATV